MLDRSQEAAPHIRAWVPVVSLTKGLEEDTRLRMSQVAEDVLPGHPFAVLTGPNLALGYLSFRVLKSGWKLKS